MFSQGLEGTVCIEDCTKELLPEEETESSSDKRTKIVIVIVIVMNVYSGNKVTFVDI